MVFFEASLFHRDRNVPMHWKTRRRAGLQRCHKKMLNDFAMAYLESLRLFQTFLYERS